jgi:hypothetical protein
MLGHWSGAAWCPARGKQPEIVLNRNMVEIYIAFRG